MSRGMVAAQINLTPVAEPESLVAADQGRNQGVLDQPRPDYDALGVRLGGFLVFPRIDLGGGFSSNAYLSRVEEGDGFAEAAPGVRAQSGWSRHAARAVARAQQRGSSWAGA